MGEITRVESHIYEIETVMVAYLKGAGQETLRFATKRPAWAFETFMKIMAHEGNEPTEDTSRVEYHYSAIMPPLPGRSVKWTSFTIIGKDGEQRIFTPDNLPASDDCHTYS